MTNIPAGAAPGIAWLKNGLIEHNLDRPAGLIECDIVLDVGCGVRPMNWYKPQRHICVDAHAPYLQRVAAVGGYECLHANALDALRLLKPGAADAIYVLDVIEHMTREDGQELVRLALMAQPRQIVIFTPLGFLPQHGDAWGLGGDHWQEHRSGWLPEDFQGWAIEISRCGPRTELGRGFFAIWTNASATVLAA